METIHEIHSGDFVASTDRTLLDLRAIHGYLSGAYWCEGIPATTVERAVAHSLPVGAYHQGAQVGFDTGAELLGPLGRDPAAAGVSFGADLADQHQVLGVGAEGGADQLVGHAVPVELGGVDVIDAELHGPAQHGQSSVPVPWRTPHPRPGELHGAEADACHLPPGELGRSAGCRVLAVVMVGHEVRSSRSWTVSVKLGLMRRILRYDCQPTRSGGTSA
jgi:hypothetical protein